MKKGDPLLTNKWFATGNLVINLDWISYIEFDDDKAQATIYMAAGKRKYKKIKLSERDSERLQEVFKGIQDE